MSTLKKFVAILAAVMFAMLAVVPVMSASADGSYTMYVSSKNGKGVRLRNGNSTDAKIIMTLGEGRPVTVTAENKGWSEVRVKVNGKNYNGYIKSEFLSKKDPSKAKQTFKAVKSFNVKVRTAAADGKVSLWNTTGKLNDEKIRDLSKTEKLTVTAESRAWYKVTDANGVVGYVAKAYVVAA